MSLAKKLTLAISILLTALLAQQPALGLSEGLPAPPPKPLGLETVALVKPLPQVTAQPIAEAQPIPVPAPQPVVTAAAPTSYQAPDYYENLVFGRESSNNPGAIAPNGACGLGQALPCSKMPCSLSDVVCQTNYFTGYMESTYGSWEAAWNHEEAYGWW